MASPDITQKSSTALLGVEQGKAPRQRLSDPKALTNIYDRFRISDDASSSNRAAVDAMFDGEPPYSPEELAEAGQAGICNVDFGEAASALESALTGYFDLTNSVDVMARVSIRSAAADPSQRTDWESIISEEFHKEVKDWPQFESHYQRLCTEFVKHGVGITYFDNDKDWRWQPSGWNGFLIDRTTPANESEITIALAERTFRVHQLYKFIEDPVTARKAGWNVAEVQKALTRAALGTQFNARKWHASWEDVQANLKENDLGLSYGSAGTIDVLHAWVQEFDGTVSHYISLQDGSNLKFLFQKTNRFASMFNALTVFTYGVGNGFYHSIRGLGFKLFPQIQMSNRLQGRAIDGAMFASSTMIQPEDEKALQNLELTYVGPYVILPPKTNIVERSLPNVATQVLPLVNHLSMQASNNTGTYRARAVTPDGQDRTAREVSLQAQQDAVLSTSATNLFYIPWKRLLNEMFRRIKNPDLLPNDPGAKEARAFVKRCKDRGVPEAAIRAVDSVEPVRAIGYGSPAMRMMAFDEMFQMAGALDEVGRHNLLRDKIASRVGYAMVDRYLPKQGTGARPTLDQKFAILENAAITAGGEVAINEDDNDYIHAQIHGGMLVKEIESLQQRGQQGQQQQQPQGGPPGQGAPQDTQAMQRVALILMRGVPHLSAHVDRMAGDKTREVDAKHFRQLVQRLGATFQELTNNLQQAAQKAQQQQGDQQGQPQQDPKIMMMLQEQQVKMKILMDTHQLKMQIKQQDAAQRMMLRDTANASKIGGGFPGAAAGMPPAQGGLPAGQAALPSGQDAFFGAGAAPQQ